MGMMTEALAWLDEQNGAKAEARRAARRRERVAAGWTPPACPPDATELEQREHRFEAAFAELEVCVGGGFNEQLDRVMVELGSLYRTRQDMGLEGDWSKEAAIEELGVRFERSDVIDSPDRADRRTMNSTGFDRGFSQPCTLVDRSLDIFTQTSTSDTTGEGTAPQPVQAPQPRSRRIKLTPASAFKPEAVLWAWEKRIPLGMLTLLAGREGIGKSTVAYQIAADFTRGAAEGVYAGKPKAVLIAATEDSWSHTIVPRLMAAGANLDLVFRLDVEVTDDLVLPVELPHDVEALGDAIDESGAALILLDPLISRLSGTLDTHKDAEVRQALEPLVRIADKHGAAVLGLIHVNKSGAREPLDMLMGSRGFPAVARSVLFAMRDTEDEDTIMLGHVKCNVGLTQGTKVFRVESTMVGGIIETGRIRWLDERPVSIRDMLADDVAGGGQTVTKEVADWLHDYLVHHGGVARSADLKKAARAEGFAENTLARARQKLGVSTESSGFPRTTYWRLPEGLLAVQSSQSSGETL